MRTSLSCCVSAALLAVSPLLGPECHDDCDRADSCAAPGYAALKQSVQHLPRNAGAAA